MLIQTQQEYTLKVHAESRVADRWFVTIEIARAGLKWWSARKIDAGRGLHAVEQAEMSIALEWVEAIDAKARCAAGGESPARDDLTSMTFA